MTHATPAAFMSHANHRRKQDDIAEQIANSGIDVLIGGGWAYFVPATLESRMPLVLHADAILEHSNGEKLAALLAPDGLNRAAERDYSLAQLARTAIQILSKNRNGFVLMIEGSQIDWAAHDNDTPNIIAEMLDFDAAIGAALDFARTQGRTLVVVTSDHETGGLAIHEGSMINRQVTSTSFTTSSYTASMVPVFAYGPSSAEFGGILDNARVGQLVIDRLLKRKTPSPE
ncbi:MAG: alkaline phosphatase [Desulfobacterales bacterium]|nr:alkaline phosphatase [Desulfobacterales bacterium]